MLKVVSFLLIVFSVGCVYKTQHVITLDRAIEGKQVGSYIVGETMKDEIYTDGKAPTEDSGLSLEFNAENILTSVTISSPAYVTEKGIRVGSSVFDVFKEYGDPVVARRKGVGSENDIFIYLDISFIFKDKKVTKIVVHD